MSHKSPRKNSKLTPQRVLFTTFFALVTFTSATNGSTESRSEAPDVFSKCWEYAVSSNLGVGIAADGSNVYFLGVDNKLHGVELALGNKLWSSELGGEVVSNLLVVADSIFVVTSSPPDTVNPSGKSILRALSRQTGITEWQAELSSSSVIWLGSVASNLLAVSSDGSISSFARGDGSTVWKINLESGVTSEPHFINDGIELGTKKNEVLKISATGSIRVSWKSEYSPTAVRVGSSGRLLVGDDRGNLTLVSSEGDRLWSFRNGAQISSASLHGSEYLATSHDNFVYKLSRGGGVKWKRRLSGRVNDRPIVLGDTAVITTVGTGSVYVLDLRNGKVLNRIETGDEVSLRVSGQINDRGFVIAGPRGLSYFSGAKCSAK